MQKYLFLILLNVVFLASCSKFGRLQKTNDPLKKYEGAMKYYEKKDYSKASLLLEEAVPLLRGKAEYEPAQLTNAYCVYYMKQYETASYFFKKFTETFARSEKAEEAYYMYAYSLYKDSPSYNLDQTSTLTAITALQSYLNNYPQTPRLEEINGLIKECRAKLEQKAYATAKLYYKTVSYQSANYRAAIVELGNFQKLYPDSDYIEEITFQKIKVAHSLAKKSIDEKKVERYNEAIGFFEEFLLKYPKSSYLKEANNMYDNSVKNLASIKKAQEKTPKKETQAEPVQKAN